MKAKTPNFLLKVVHRLNSTCLQATKPNNTGLRGYWHNTNNTGLRGHWHNTTAEDKYKHCVWKVLAVEKYMISDLRSTWFCIQMNCVKSPSCMSSMSFLQFGLKKLIDCLSLSVEPNIRHGSFDIHHTHKKGILLLWNGDFFLLIYYW